MGNVKTFVDEFYKRNLFERLIIYIFLAYVVVTFVFQLILGQWSFIQSQNRQWVFYAFLGLDYLISFRKIIDTRVTFNVTSSLALLFLIMVAQGLFVGVMQHNPAFTILNDTIPLLMIALNIWRMQSYSEDAKPIDFRRLFHECTLLAFTAWCFAEISILRGDPSTLAVPANPIYYPMFLAAIFFRLPVNKLVWLMAIVMIVFAIPDMNRTTMLLMAIVCLGYAGLSVIRDPFKGIIIIIFLICLAALTAVFIPKDSAAYKRIVRLQEISLDDETGSVGERRAEWLALNQKLNSKGETIRWLGLGFGGTYNIHFTHGYVTNYGHAHYSWSWFNLRFGYTGYFYLTLLSLALLYNLAIGLLTKTETSVFVGLMCLFGVIYMLTYVNAIFLLMGVQFLNLRRDAYSKQQS